MVGGGPPVADKRSEINTAKGRLVLTTSNEGTDLKIVIEKPGADGTLAAADGKKTVRVS